MLESKQISAYDDASNAFVGIRFVLFGFDPVSEEKVRSKLLEGGGVDAVNYGPGCTHVIVDRLVYDDPICVAAQKDGKILVTGLWVAHSFDVGMPLDPTNSVLYGPVRDLNGIPGANSLVICLTGYQRQDRDDIMNMVAMMGATFSKPLVATKVTHLICYKFEGEKYELAKKLNTMKLVNHRWLEDCLKAWELLPEADYAKSGYDLEMEVEAKDSEEETEDMASLDLKMKSLVNPQNIRLENKNVHQSPEQVGASRNSAYITAEESFANVGNTSKTKSTPRKETSFGKASLSRDMSNSSCARSPAKIPPEVPSNVPDGTSISGKNEHVLPSASGSAKKSMKSSLPLRSERIENISGSPSSNVSKTGLRGGLSTPTKGDLDGIDFHDIRSPLKGSSLLPDEGKKRTSVPRGSSRSPVLSHSPNNLIKTGSAPKQVEMPVSRSSNGLCRAAFYMPPTNGTTCLREDDSGDFVLPSEKNQDGTGSGGVKTPQKGASSYLDEKETSCLPSKKKLSVSHRGSKSTKLSLSPKILAASKSDTKPMEILVLREENGSGDLNMPSERSENGVEAGGIKTPLEGASLHVNEEHSRSLPGRVKSTVLCSNSKSTKLSRSRKLVESGLDTKATERPGSPPTDITSHLREEVLSASKEALPVSTLQEDREECNHQTPKRSRGRPKKQKLLHSDVNVLSPEMTKPCTGEAEMHQRFPPDISLPFPSASGTKSSGHVEFDSSKVDHCATKSKSPKKKMLARKTLGSKPTICKGKVARNIGFLSALLQNEFAGLSNGAVPVEDMNNVPLAENVVTVSPRTNEDDETEAAECDGPDEIVMGSKDIVEVEEPHSEKITPSRKQPSKKTTKSKKGAKSGVKKSTEAPEREGLNESDMRSKYSAEVEEPHSEKITPSRKQPSKKTTKSKKGAKSGVKKSTEAPEHEGLNESDMRSKYSAEVKEPHSEKPTPSRKQPKEKNSKMKKGVKSGVKKSIEAPDCEGPNEFDIRSKDSAETEEPPSEKPTPIKQLSERTTKTKKEAKSGIKKSTAAKSSVCSQNTELPESKLTGDDVEKNITAGRKRPLAKSKVSKLNETKQDEKMTILSNEETVVFDGKSKTTKRPLKKLKSSGDVEKENKPMTNEQHSLSCDQGEAGRSTSCKLKRPLKNQSKAYKVNKEDLNAKTEPAWFILSGHRLQRKEFQQVIKRLRGRVCRDSHNWSYQATHFIVPDPIRRTEKFFAAAASGSWILKTDYLTASTEAGRFVSEEPYEWHKKCLTEDGAINLEAPRKWRLLRERTGHGALYGMRIVIYGECIAPPLETLKRVVKAGDGTILATSPPYTRFLNSRIDFAIVSPGMPRVDMWVQEFLRHEIPCILADYLVEYVCKPGYSLERHVQYGTHAWAKRSLENVIDRMEESIEDPKTPEDQCVDDVACQVCGMRDRGDEMLICGDENGAHGCSTGTHIDCLDPPLEAVPEKDWFCRDCCRKGKAKGDGRNSKKRASKLK